MCIRDSGVTDRISFEIAGSGFVSINAFSLSVTEEEASVLKGDVDLDSAVNFSDIPPFIAILSGGGYQAEADCNCDEVLNFSDIPAFIAILTGN